MLLLNVKFFIYSIFLFIPIQWVFRYYYNIPLLSPYLILGIIFFIYFLRLILNYNLRFKFFNTMPIIIYSIFVLSVIVFNKINYDYLDNLYHDYFTFNLSILAASLLAFCVGVFYPRKSNNFFVLIFFSYIVFSFLIVDFNNFSLDYDFLNSDYGSLYLNISDYFGLVSLVVFSKKIKSQKVYVYFLIATIILYCLGSRASFYSFLLSFYSALFIFFRIKLRLIFLLIFTVLLVILFANLETRIFSLVFNFYDDPSALERLDQFTHAIINISENLFFSDYYNIVTFYKTYGAYAHSFISHYQVYGFVPMLMICLMYLRMVSAYRNSIRLLNRDEVDDLILFLVPYVCILGVFARGYIWDLNFFIYGLLVQQSYYKFTEKINANQ